MAKDWDSKQVLSFFLFLSLSFHLALFFQSFSPFLSPHLLRREGFCWERSGEGGRMGSEGEG
jgi:hypothetical protein